MDTKQAKRALAMMLQRYAEDWAAAYAKDESLKFQALWAAKRAKTAWADYDKLAA